MLNRRGFTLIEMLMALGVVAVLATLALPSLSEALHRTRRIEAVAALAALQQAQERHRGTQDTYTAELDALGWPEAQSPSGAYSLEVAHASETGYLLVARATASGSQAGDARCAVLAVQVEAGFTARGSACSGCTLAQPLSDAPRCWGHP
jgi:type IV pilus assembly protein PilE